MRNEKGPKRGSRTGSTGYKGKSNSTDQPRGTRGGASAPKKFSKTYKSKEDTPGKKPGPKKFGTGFKKENDKKWDDRREKSPTSRAPYKKKINSANEDGDKKPFAKKTFGDKPFSKDKKPFTSRGPYKKKFDTETEGGDKKPFARKSFGDKDFSKNKKPYTSKTPYKNKDEDANASTETGRKTTTSKSGSYSDYKKKGSGSSFAERKEYKKKTGIKTYTDKNDPDKVYTKETEIVRNKNASKSFKKVKVYQKNTQDDDGLVRLNKFIANAGICSRREADTYIQTGVVTVNGVIITELGYKVKPDDRVLFHDKPIMGEKLVYILLNKPKDYITTSKDPQNRKTVLELVNGVKERIFPVGRLDRNTTGVLLLTNDGALAEKLMHPRKGVSKIYHVELDKKFTAPDLEQMRKGIELEDGFFAPDEVDYAEGMDKHHVGVEIHSGANRIVRRLFEALDYNVIKLDRVVYAGLTKKGLTRGKWRFLKDSELHALQMM
jgi:23S rRNA pseudouridine2605 synthase